MRLKQEVSCLSANVTNKVEEWHKKLEHISLRTMKKLLNLSDRLNLTVNELENSRLDCEICVKTCEISEIFRKRD